LFELLFLGTSASAPSVHRSLPSLLIQHEDHRYLVDCGEGTQRQILTAGAGFKNLNKILVTHGHLDHILGLAGLLATLIRWESMEDMDIYGGKDAIYRIQDLIYTVVLRGSQIPAQLHFHNLTYGTFIDEKNFSISCFPVIHRGSDSVGYLFQERGRRPFLPEKAEALAIPPGPWRRDLTNGEGVSLPDGRFIEPDQVLGPFKPGATLAVVGDTGETDSLISYIQGADALVIEATYLEEEIDLAKKFSHMTAKSSAMLAKTAGVQQLYLTHVSRRHREKDILAEAQSIFPNTIVARDLSQYFVKR
jgi:ribonuclease Z